MLKPKQKSGVNYHYNSTFKVKPQKSKKSPVSKVKKRSQELNDHWSRVIKVGPAPGQNVIPGQLTIHHCHSGSMADNGINRGVSQKASDWLVIALPQPLHVMGKYAIDGSIGVRTWELEFGTQFDALCWLSRKIGYNVFRKAGFDIDIEGVGD